MSKRYEMYALVDRLFYDRIDQQCTEYPDFEAVTSWAQNG
jgi:hypothetical protein